MRNRRGQPDADRRIHHLPEADQRGGRARFLAERGERLRGAQRVDDAHAEQEHAHRGEKRQEGRADTATPAASRCCRWPPRTIRRGSSGRARSAAPVLSPACRGEYDQHGAGEEQAQLDRRKMHRLDQHAGRGREHREQPAHDQAHGRGRHHETAVGDQAEIVFGDRERIERRPRRMMGFAEHPAIGERAEHRKGGDEREFGTPAEIMVERAAEQRREAGRGRHRDHDQRHRARQCGAGEHVARNGARQHGGGAGAGGLDDAAGQQVWQVGGEAAPDAAGEEHRKSDQYRPAAAVAVRDRPDHELADREHRQEDRDGGGDRRARDVQRGRHLRQRGQQDVGRQRPGGRQRRQHRDLQRRWRRPPGGALASIATVWSAMGVPVLI